LLLRRLLAIGWLTNANRDNNALDAIACHNKPRRGESIEMKPGPMRWLVLGALLLMLVLTTTSAYIRLSQAGLGCADWPDCYGRARLPEAGQLLPERTPLFWAHALHRLAASSVGVLLVLIVFVGRKDLQGTGARLAAWTVLALAGFLAILGVVTPSGLPAVTLGNLLGGMSMVALLWWLYQRGRGASAGAGHRLLWFAFAALTLQISLGGMIGARHAALACTTLPECAGGWWPVQTDWRLFNPFFGLPASGMVSAALVPLAMAHRYGALLVAAILCVLGVRAIRRGARTAAPSWVLLGLLTLQLLLGAGMVLANFPLLLALMHNLCAALLLCATVSLLWRDVATEDQS
jgi:cytochrome c oxidase assembly protein subunit 15